MDEKSLYTRFLGIGTPWRVKHVWLDESSGEVRVSVEYRSDRISVCPVCGKRSSRYDTRARSWRHLDSCQYKTVVTADVPRIDCKDHGVLQLPVPWADPKSGLTAMFEASIIDLLKETSVSAVARRLGLSWDAVYGVQKRAVARGLERRALKTPKHISVDETSYQKRHEYVTIVGDVTDGSVLHVADSRTTESLEAYFNQLSNTQLSQIESVSMDMWAPYIKATRAYIPEADRKICFDKYHVASYLGNAVDKTRRSEHRELKAIGDDRLKNTRFLWLSNPNNMSDQQTGRFDHLRRAALKTAEAWGFKELAMGLWEYIHPAWATKAWNRWLDLVHHSQLSEVHKVAKTIKEHLWGIVNAIVLKRTNAMAESINSRIQKIKARACGYRNRDRFREAIYFHCAKLNLYPDSYKPLTAHT